MASNILHGGPLRVVVLAGGESAEREVSLESGSCVSEALRQRGHRVLQFDPAHLALHEIPKSTDVILPMLHGTGGEDGSLQLRLNRLGIPWFGSSAEASALTFDKVATRNTLAAAGFPVAPGLDLHHDAPRELVRDASHQIGYPQVIKPSAQGSSVGITIVDSDLEVHQAFACAAHWGSSVLIEKYIAGREVTVPVIAGEAFPAIEILTATRWYDYTAKYRDDRTSYDLKPKDLPASLNDMVLNACKACGVTAISRTDLRIDLDGQPWILEINTIPGMTSHSLVPMSAQARGVRLGELLDGLLHRCVEARRDRKAA